MTGIREFWQHEQDRWSYRDYDGLKLRLLNIRRPEKMACFIATAWIMSRAVVTDPFHIPPSRCEELFEMAVGLTKRPSRWSKVIKWLGALKAPGYIPHSCYLDIRSKIIHAQTDTSTGVDPAFQLELLSGGETDLVSTVYAVDCPLCGRNEHPLDCEYFDFPLAVLAGGFSADDRICFGFMKRVRRRIVRIGGRK